MDSGPAPVLSLSVGWLYLGSRVLPFCPFCLGFPYVKPSIRKNGTLIYCKGATQEPRYSCPMYDYVLPRLLGFDMSSPHTFNYALSKQYPQPASSLSPELLRSGVSLLLCLSFFLFRVSAVDVTSIMTTARDRREASP